MSDLIGNHIVGFPTRWLKYKKSCAIVHKLEQQEQTRNKTYNTWHINISLEISTSIFFAHFIYAYFFSFTVTFWILYKLSDLTKCLTKSIWPLLIPTSTQRDHRLESYSVLRPFQDYFSSYETGQSVGWLKRENPSKNHLAHPQAEHGLSHMWPVRGLEPTPDTAVR